MIAVMATYTGPNPALADLARMARDEIGGWLGGYEGYRGLIILTDQQQELARVITLWADSEAEERSRRARGAMRDQVAVVAGMDVTPQEIYDVPVCDVFE